MNKTSSKVAKRSLRPAPGSEPNHKRVVAAARSAVRRTLKQHKALGTPIVVWRDGKIVRIAGDKIKL